MLIITELEESLAESLYNQKERSVGQRFKTQIKKTVTKDESGKDVEVKNEESVINKSLDNPYYVISRIAEYVNYFNTIGEFTDRILDVELSQIQFPNELIPFIEPRTIRYRVGTYWSKDLRLIKQFEDFNGKGLSITEWNQLLYALRAFKKVTTLKNMTTLDQLKKNVSLTDIEDFCICRGKVHYQDTAFVPIKIDDAVFKAVYDPMYFSHDYNVVLKRWISELKWTSSRD